MLLGKTATLVYGFKIPIREYEHYYLHLNKLAQEGYLFIGEPEFRRYHGKSGPEDRVIFPTIVGIALYSSPGCVQIQPKRLELKIRECELKSLFEMMPLKPRGPPKMFLVLHGEKVGPNRP